MPVAAQKREERVITLIGWFSNIPGHVNKTRSPRHVYAFSATSGRSHCLVITGCPLKDPLRYLRKSVPEFYTVLLNQLERGSLDLDLERYQAVSEGGDTDEPDVEALLEGFATLTLSPRQYVDLDAVGDMVSIVLYGGKGSRMRSKDIPKVCFPCAGIPAINRLLDSLEHAGVREHVVVVGENGPQVVREVTEGRDTAVFVHQIRRNGTGSAARQAAGLLKSQHYQGTVLVVPGDKIFHNTVLERFIHTFRESGADAAMMAGEKRYWPDSGRIVFDTEGNLLDIIEKRDVQKLVLSERILGLAASHGTISVSRVREEILREVPTVSKAEIMFPDLWARLDRSDNITRSELDILIPEETRRYSCETSAGLIDMSGEELEQTCTTVNAFVYIFTAEAFFKYIFTLGTDNAQKEEYLTNLFRLLARDYERQWNIITVPVRDGFEVMSFNSPEELHRIEEYYAAGENDSAISERLLERIDPRFRGKSLRPVVEWTRIIEDFGPEIRTVFHRNEDLHQERRDTYLQALRKFIRVYGTGHTVLIARSPGRVNLMGRHVEHRGGFTNYMAINREVILVAGARNDDIINRCLSS